MFQGASSVSLDAKGRLSVPTRHRDVLAATAANQLTLLRLLLVPVFALSMFYTRPGWALLIFAVAGVTDAFDGFIARRTGHSPG